MFANHRFMDLFSRADASHNNRNVNVRNVAGKPNELMGKIKNSAPRLPLYKMSEASTEKLRKVLADCGLV